MRVFIVLLHVFAALHTGAEGADQDARRTKISVMKMQSVVDNKIQAANFERSSGGLVQAQDYSSELVCDAGSVVQYQSSYCDTDSDGNDIVVMAVFTDSTCTGDPVVTSAFDGTAELASLDQCTPGTVSIDGTMGTCVDSKLIDMFFDNSQCIGESVFNVTQTKCEPFCVSDGTSGTGTCISLLSGAEIEECMCDSSCGTCGFSDEESYEYGVLLGDGSPDTPFDCIACKDGLTKLVLFEDGTGVCVPPAEPQCFDTPGGVAVADCTCDPSCGSCGYGSAPTGASSCISCQPDTPVLEQVNSDGSGSCRMLEMFIVVDSDGDVEIFLMGMSRSEAAAVGFGIFGVMCIAGVLTVVALYAGGGLGRSQYLKLKMEKQPLTQETQELMTSGGYGTQQATTSLDTVVESQP